MGAMDYGRFQRLLLRATSQPGERVHLRRTSSGDEEGDAGPATVPDPVVLHLPLPLEQPVAPASERLRDPTPAGRTQVRPG